MDEHELAGAIAVIGMSGQFPGAHNLETYWNNIVQGIESITFFSDSDLANASIPKEVYDNPNYVKAKGIINHPEYFDAGFFGYSTSEAINLDPQQRLFLECAWQALEHAGYDSLQTDSAIGVYASSGYSTYLLANQINIHQANSEQLYQLMLGNDKDYLSTRVSYELNLTGPSVNIQTACSSSLVSVHIACQSLLNGECDIALAGGVSVSFPQVTGYQYVKGMILSPDGHCRAFDEQASGTLEGNGLGIVVLKRMRDALRDRDTIHAIIRGSAINNDGAHKVGYTSPSIDQQSAVINEALSVANVTANQLSYIETHGTGTPLGDPIEISALSQVFNQKEIKKESCVLGAVKTNIGHLNTASGIAGLLKTILALKNEIIPPTLHFKNPNPELNLKNSPFKISSKPLAWKRSSSFPRIAGVSSFGIGGTNAHLILQEPPINSSINSFTRKNHLILFSAKSSQALKTTAKNLTEFLKKNTEYSLADIAYTTQVGRRTFEYKGMVISSTIEDAINKLGQFSDKDCYVTNLNLTKDFIWMFPGQGAQYKNMALHLYKTETIFQNHVDECCSLFSRHLKINLLELLFCEIDKDDSKLINTIHAQPLLFTIEYALAMTLITWGLKPSALIGHSLGEYAAACIAGIFSLTDAIILVSTRCQLMQELPLGAMLSIAMPERDLKNFLNDNISISAINSATSCVVSGPTDNIDKLQLLLDSKNIAYKRLHTSHAFHSVMMEPILKPFSAIASTIQLHPPKIPMVSNVSGTWLTDAQATDSNYWVAQLRQTVLFSASVKTIFKSTSTIFLEIGPGHILGSLVKQNLPDQPQIAIFSTLPHPLDNEPDDLYLLNMLGKLWLHGIKLNFAAYHAQEQRRRVPMPTYPFEKQYYSLFANNKSMDIQRHAEPEIQLNYTTHHRTFLNTDYTPPTNELERILVEFWEDLFLMRPIGISDNFFSLGGNSLMGIQFIGKIRSTFHIDIPIRQLFDLPTIQQISQCIVTHIKNLTEDEIATINLPFSGVTSE